MRLAMTATKPKLKRVPMKLTIPLEKNKHLRKKSIWNVKWFSLNNQRTVHWSKQAEARRTWKELVRNTIPFKKRQQFDHPKITMTIYFHSRRKRDMDNFFPIYKPILDGLKQAGVIEDDNSKAIDLQMPIFDYDKDKPRVEVEITEADERVRI